MHEITLVVPTIRPEILKEFLNRWIPIGLLDVVDLIIMEDNPTKTFELDEIIHSILVKSEILIDPAKMCWFHLAWDDIEFELDKKQWIIPRRSDTVRSFAYYWAWKTHGLAYTKYVATLDDDCYPEAEGVTAKNFFDTHVRCIAGRSKWFNTLNNVKPRGIPFYNTGERHDIVLNHGLWTNVLDYDAPTQLANPVEENHSYDNKIVPHGSFFPMCGMNMMWKVEYTVWMYHLMMGKMGTNICGLFSGEKLPFDRFGDIWCGLFVKKLCDIFGLSVTTGVPYIHHERASNPFTNLKKEANGIEVNEVFWKYVDKFDSDAKTEIDAYIDLGEHISKYNEFPEHVEYFKMLGKAMMEWAGLFVDCDA